MTTTEMIDAASPAHLMTLFAERVARGDLEGVLDLYEPDAVFQPEPGVELRGHDQSRAGLFEFLRLEPRISYRSEPNVVTSGDLALVANDWTMTGTGPDGTPVVEGGTSADVVRRQAGGSWRVLIDQPRGEPGS
jgi:uncharacterized protein (TIGR02246 family)